MTIPETTKGVATTAVGGLSAIGAVVAWGLDRAGVNLDMTETALVTGGVVTVLTAIGARGIVGLARLVWRGDKSSP